MGLISRIKSRISARRARRTPTTSTSSSLGPVYTTSKEKAATGIGTGSSGSPTTSGTTGSISSRVSSGGGGTLTRTQAATTTQAATQQAAQQQAALASQAAAIRQTEAFRTNQLTQKQVATIARAEGSSYVGIGLSSTPTRVGTAQRTARDKIKKTKVVRKIASTPFYDKSLGEAFAPEGFQKESEVLKKGKEIYVSGGGGIVKTPKLDVGGKGSRAIISEFIPTTPSGLITTAGLTAGSIAFPSIVGTGVAASVATTSYLTVRDPFATPTQKAAAGIAGVAGVVGTAAGVTPYVRGIKARVSSEYAKVKTAPEGFKFISGVGKESIDVGIIPSKSGNVNVNLPKVSPLKGGAFRVTGKTRELFIGEGQTVATSQISFFKTGKEIPLQREFFVSPQDPITGLPVTRASRMGIIEPLEFPKLSSSEISFGFPKQPQIGLERGAIVGWGESFRSYKIGRGAELEAIRSSGVITDIQKVGTTVIKGQGVDIYFFRTRGGKAVSRGFESRGISTGKTSRISGERISSAGISSPTTSNILEEEVQEE